MDEEAVRNLIRDKVVAADAGDYFGLLGIEPDASKAQVQKAYFELAKVLHPDKLQKRNITDVQAEAAKVFKVLSEAYKTLSDDAARREYAASVRASAPQPEGPLPPLKNTQELLRARPTDLHADEKEAAKIFFHKGALLMKKGAVDQALEFFKRALECDADVARYELQLGWAYFLSDQLPERERMRSARRHLEAALRLDDKNPEGHYFMARFHKAAGSTEECRAHLLKALAQRENYIDAKRELRLLDMRERGQKPDKKAAASASSGGKAGRTDRGKDAGKGKGGADRPGRWPFGLDRLFKKT